MLGLQTDSPNGTFLRIHRMYDVFETLENPSAGCLATSTWGMGDADPGRRMTGYRAGAPPLDQAIMTFRESSRSALPRMSPDASSAFMLTDYLACRRRIPRP